MQGLLLVDKPEGLTSFDVVHKIRKLTGEKKVGHTGTLDPLATGVLPILIGRATRLSDLIMSKNKKYRAGIRLGTVTDTLDVTGEVISKREVNVDDENLRAVLNSFLGEIDQIPPMYSAIKQNGVKMYKLARKGEQVELKPRRVTIHSIILTKPLENGEFEIEVDCSKGTYIRSLCRDIGEKLNCGAVMTSLRRISTGNFLESDCVPLDDLNENNISEFIKPAETAFWDCKKITVSEKQAARFSNGGELDILRLRTKNFCDNEQVLVYFEDICLGLGRVKNGAVKQEVPLNTYELGVSEKKPSAIALGTFDGLHIGHRAVLDGALRSGYNKVALIFSFPPSGADAIMTAYDKKQALEKMGFDKIAFLKFEEVKDMPAHDFEQYLISRFNVAKLCFGYDYTYGKGRSGNAETLREFCKLNGIEYAVEDEVKIYGNRASSTLIRQLIAKGEIEKANEMMFSPFSFSAEIVSGDKRGRALGFPTINQVYPYCLVKPKFGVYKVSVEIEGETYIGISNIGVRPTFETEQCTCETFLKDFSGDLYGKNAKITLFNFIREERKFASAEELKIQVEKDIKTAFG